MVVLPLALVLATVATLGSYYETSDDTSFAWLFSGVLALKPVVSLPLFFHGYGHALAAAYTAAPHVPWLGLLTASLLAVATTLTFAVLDKLLRPYLKPRALVLALVAFYFLAWLEHWLWFSHVRVSILLAGAVLLFVAQRPANRSALMLGVAGIGAAWLIRPSLALFGFGLSVPAALLLADNWRRLVPILCTAALGLGLATVMLSALQTDAESQMRQRDNYLARILDFDQLRPVPRTTADSLGTAAVEQWLLGDATLVNTAFVQRAYKFNSTDFLGRTLPAKLRLRAGLVARDYFPILLALAAIIFGVLRQRQATTGFWLTQIGFGGILFVFAGLLKLPPRIALPIFDFWLITNLVFWCRAVHFLASDGAKSTQDNLTQKADFFLPKSLASRWVGAGLAVLIVALYGVKNLHRYQVLQKEQKQHELALREIAENSLPVGNRARIRVLAGTSDLLKSLSPFKTYSLGPGPVVMLSGWQSHDPSQAHLFQALGGTPQSIASLRQIARNAPNTQWLLTGESAYWLNRRFYFDAGGQPALILVPVRALAADTSLHYYRVVIR
ncbi:hypothetical protein SAMN04515668_0517 [Hymenobacter arizonensis]|uniref:Glycosyltransferase RgtA/B/C/D-like domain-containing protein n=1 Tax=Hymenobacter arizonensis TaxID=1227077 RepID=A0A1I5TL82_HYMAR|nr:hypothetical protein SAMN04515668_0517 [Hymenobacter arizonensis]